MKKVFNLLLFMGIGLTAFSQQDSASQKKHHHPDWNRMDSSTCMEKFPHWPMPPHHWGGNHVKPANISTNWLVVDLGFANYNDKTNYAGTTAQTFAPGSQSYWFSLRNNKSVDVNIWLFWQRLNVVKHIVNLKYGLGVELNNYRYETNILFLKNPTTVVRADTAFSKNKLATDYVTVPFMVNFNFTPNRKDGFGISFGVSAGYLYSSRQKYITYPSDKHKTFDDFDLNPWKISWIAEAQLGPVKLYGSLATQSMFKSRGLDQTPYTFGIRLSN